jgi:hypothetical protein
MLSGVRFEPRSCGNGSRLRLGFDEGVTAVKNRQALMTSMNGGEDRDTSQESHSWSSDCVLPEVQI